ncbi:WS/DGAT domain-containing protein [Nocardia sp. NBC_01503]|uniref:wax ester/triacylglycerol synthase domain-containing protein n=1 Tax=Nocardia sp. NBC_01503 TaxID=2975997 RepID=UPI002E7AB70C|nr:wax ester/triacylglycerol synthase domain-containing protein [Nocardia sp. NBC_01503]WTL31533.1 WS/DGAT domain-containing protein [Nocardia sp. NBC_01503]
MNSRESHMSQSDLFTWSMEQDPALRSTIVSVMILDRAPEWDRLVRMIERGTHAVGRFRHRLVAVPFGLAPPRWRTDPNFDVAMHVRRAVLPAPGNLSAVLEFARSEAMTAFDPVRPLWQFTVLDGLEDGRSALVFKVHHSLTDGIGGIQIAGEMVDFARGGTQRDELPDAGYSEIGVLGDILAWNWSVGRELMRGGVSILLPAVRRVATDPIGAVRAGTALATSLLRLARPITRTLSPLMTERGLARQVAVLDVPFQDLHASAHRAGCTVNDAFLTALLIGMRDYHAKHGSKVEHLRVAMPISLRKDGDPIGGNRITLARFAVPVDVPGTADLMHALDEVVEGWRHEPAIPLSNAVAGTFNRLPVGLIAGMFKHVDFIASDVPGSPVPLYVAGAEIERIYAFGPTTGTAFNATLVTHAGTCCVGMNMDTAAIPDPDLLVDCVTAGFRTVLDFAHW